MTQTVLNGGSKTQQDGYTGPANELAVDESNLDLRLHDGATPGGRIFLNRDNADERYQQRSDELDGLLGFEPQQRGWLVRLGPADYRLRTITVDGQNLEIANANGYAGNPLIGLAPVIDSEHTWNGQQLFNAVVEFSAGINANVSGDLDGNSTGTHTGPVNGNASGDHTGSFTGDVDVRGQTLQLDDGQIPLTALAGLLAYVRAQAFPIGGIIEWSGIVDDIPAGWVLCDGNNGAPDMRNRFVVGAGDAYDPHETGGSSTHNHTVSLEASGAHNHTGTVGGTAIDVSQMPPHKHGSGVCDNSATDVFNHSSLAASPTTNNSIESNSADGVHEGYTTETGGGQTHDHDLDIENSGEHTHDVNPEGASNIPPYYAICFIMRVAD